MQQKPIRDQLLGNRQDIVRHPIQDKARWEIYEQECHTDREDQHNLCLCWIHCVGRDFLLDKHRRAHDDRQYIEGILH